LGHLIPLPVQFSYRFEHPRKVARLIASPKVQSIIHSYSILPTDYLDIQVFRRPLSNSNLPLLRGKNELAMLFQRYPLKNTADLRLPFAHDNRYTVFDDTGLLRSNFGQGIAQHMHVVITDVGDDR